MSRNGNWYDTAQICINGHVITSFAETYKEQLSKFCNKCGNPTITQCTNCSTNIRGYHHSSVAVIATFFAPSFCHNCGKPYPWTEAKISAAKELTQTLKELSPQEKQDLEKNIDDIVRDTPRTNLASLQFKDTLSKIGKGAAKALGDILVDVLSETAKKVILG